MHKMDRHLSMSFQYHMCACVYIIRIYTYAGVSKNRGTPKWTVFSGKTLLELIIWGKTPIFGNTHK